MIIMYKCANFHRILMLCANSISQILYFGTTKPKIFCL